MQQDYAKNRQVAEAFYQHARRTVDESDLPVLEVNGAQQRGDDFGTRLANAFADAFAQGYERVIAVGSDCPRLHEVDWSDVTEHLDAGAPVIGPTPNRDGTYLIGLRRSQFDKAEFAALPWTSAALFPALLDHLSAETGPAPVRLAARDDVNGHGELIALLRSPASPSGRLLATLQSVLGPAGHVRRSETRNSNAHFCGRRSRAPPSFPKSTRLSA